MSNPKKHHFVPQFFLRQFTDKSGRQIYVFDKRTGRVFRSNVSNVAAENRLYEFTIGDTTATLENGLAQFESKAADVLRQILSAGSLAQITVLERTILSALVAQLLLRSPQRQAAGDEMIEQVREKVRMQGTNPDQVPQLKLLTANEKKILTAQFLSSTWQEFIPVIAFKTWVLHSAPQSDTLYLSDNPVVMHNEMDFGPRGNLGLAVEGIEVYLPLGSTTCLAMYCPKMTADLELEYREIAAATGRNQLPRRNQSIDRLLTAFRTGEPVPFECPNVEFINSLQVWNAARYVYAARDDFDLAKYMLSKHPTLRFGPRPKVA